MVCCIDADAGVVSPIAGGAGYGRRHPRTRGIRGVPEVTVTRRIAVIADMRLVVRIEGNRGVIPNVIGAIYGINYPRARFVARVFEVTPDGTVVADVQLVVGVHLQRRVLAGVCGVYRGCNPRA